MYGNGKYEKIAGIWRSYAQWKWPIRQMYENWVLGLAGRQWKYGIFVLILDFLKNSEKLRVEFPGRNMLQGTENYLELHFY